MAVALNSCQEKKRVGWENEGERGREAFTGALLCRVPLGRPGAAPCLGNVRAGMKESSVQESLEDKALWLPAVQSPEHRLDFFECRQEQTGTPGVL